MRIALISALVVVGGCFSAPTNAGNNGSSAKSASGGSSAGTTTATPSSSGHTSGSTGAATTSGSGTTVASASSATASGTVVTATASSGVVGTGSTGTATATGTSGSSGTTGGPCNVEVPCAVDQICNVSLSDCATDPQISVSTGGTCVDLPACASSASLCEGDPCSSDGDCAAFEACTNGTCQGFACPGLPVDCPAPCVPYGIPHSCDSACVCSACPGADAGVACDVNNPCPLGSDCIFSTSPCPGSGGLGSPSLDLGGTCVPQVVCPGGSCVGMLCTADTQCADFEACINGSCQTLECPPLPYECTDPSCTIANSPHSCASYCLCPSCPSADAGPDLDAGLPTCTCAYPGVPGYECCGAACRYLEGDTANCGACGHACGPGEICQNGGCTLAMCNLNDGCVGVDAGGGGPSSCCGSTCCGAGSICCQVQEGVEYMGCFDADAGCPLGCPLCD